MIRFKAFIYRFFCIFGISIYLANKEENAYIASNSFSSELAENIARGSWQAKHGFTSVWTYGKPFFVAMKQKINHAFRSY